jgi:hypothetical protein
VKCVAARDARFAHPACHHGSVRRGAAFGRKDAFGRDHPVDVVGSRFRPHQDCFTSPFFPRNGIVGREDDLTGSRAGRCVETLACDAELLTGVDPRVKKVVERLCVDRGDGAAFVNQPFGNEIERNLYGSFGGAFGAARLQHEELAALDGKLEILNVAVVALEPRRYLLELLVDLRLPPS